MFSSFAVKPPLAFSLILTVASRLLHPYSTDDKTSSLMMKQFSTVRDTQRGSQSYTEKRRGRGRVEVIRRRRGEREEIEVTSFEREWAAFPGAWCLLPALRSCSVEVAQHSNDLLINLKGKKWSLHPIPPPSGTLREVHGVPQRREEGGRR